MTTNPPLTAKSLAKDLVAIYNPVAGSQDLGVPYIATRIEAYAAQQNAELVAENEKLKKDADTRATLLATLTDKIRNTQAENERLKQENAKLAGQIVRLEADYKQAAEEVKVLKGELAQAELKASQRGKAWIELSSQNERLKQHNKALIPLAAWAKTHGHELTCAIRKPMPEGVDRVVCTCGWVNAHNHSGLTTNQHIELAKYSEAQPPKEAT